MRRGRREKPVISLASIEAALKGFSYNSRELAEAATLESLALVDLRLAQASRPSAEALRAYTVQRLLADFLQDGLNQQAQVFDLASVTANASRKEAQAHLRDIGAIASPSLKAWSSIYYRYFRSDLGFTVEDLATYLGYSAKQFGRYENEGLRLLRDKLIEAEWQARQEFLQRFLLRAIPESIVALIGREKSSDTAAWAFGQNPPMPLFITGAEGIGKTALAASIAKQLINSNRLDYLVWLSRPKRLEEIYNALEDNLLPFPSRMDWRALLGADSLLLVLDDISQLAMTSAEWESLNGLLSPAYLILTNREFQPILNRLIPIPLAELDINEAELFLASQLPNESLLNKIPLEEIGGNPRLLAYAAQQVLAGYRPQKAVNGLRLAYDGLYAELAETAQIAWLGLAAGIECNDETLIAKGLLHLNEDSYQLAPSAKSYIIVRYAEDERLQAAFQNYLLGNPVRFSVLLCDWLHLDKATVVGILAAYEPKTQQELRQWRHLTEPYLADAQAALRLAYGKALRRLASPEAETYLNDLIQECGQSGDFVAQALVRYELALLYQSQAKFEIALRDYAAIEAYIQKRPNESLSRNILLQRARIAIEAGNGQLALQYLQKHGIQTEEDRVLESEAYFLLGEGEKSRAIAYTSLNVLRDKPELAASLHTLLGRSFQAEAIPVKAIDHLNAALSFSEQFNGDFDIARSKTNLAAAYIAFQPDYFDEADALLQEARRIQSRIGDVLGLSASEMNLGYLQRLRLATYRK